MKVNLKKAAALSSALSAIAFVPVVSYKVDPYGDMPTQAHIDKGRELLATAISGALRRNKAIYTIRKMIGEANIVRISGLLASKAELEKNLAVLNAVPLRDASTNLEALKRQAEALTDPEKGKLIYGGRDLTFSVQTDDLIIPNQKALRKAVRIIDEELQHLNFTTTIELPDDVVAILTENDLV